MVGMYPQAQDPMIASKRQNHGKRSHLSTAAFLAFGLIASLKIGRAHV